MSLTAAIRTLKASRWALLKARWFGQKRVGRDGDIEVTICRYKGVDYLVNFRQVKP